MTDREERDATEARVRELAEETGKIVAEEAIRLLRSGAVEQGSGKGLYWLPKMLVSAACLHASGQWEIDNSEWQRGRKNLRHF